MATKTKKKAAAVVEPKQEVVVSYKGFDKDWKCPGRRSPARTAIARSDKSKSANPTPTPTRGGIRAGD